MSHYRIELVAADDRDPGDTFTLDDARLPLAVGTHTLLEFAVSTRYGVRRVTVAATVEEGGRS